MKHNHSIFRSGYQQDFLLMKKDNVNVRDMLQVLELNLKNKREDTSNMDAEKCCGLCCWFYAEDTYGYGACPYQFGEVVQCDQECSKKKEFVSKKDMRHHMAVLLQANRYRRDHNVPAIYRMPNPTELGKAIDFAIKYMKIFSNL